MPLINRREFVRQSTSALAAATLPMFHKNIGATPNADLAVVKGDWRKRLNDGLDVVGGITRFIPKNALVVLKPNLSFPVPPQWAATTNPEVIAETARICLQAGARKILVVDHPMRAPEKCWQRTGMASALAGLAGVTPVMLKSQRQFEPVVVPNGKEIAQVEVAKVIAKADCVINIPVAKSHSNTFVSLGIKNLMGVIWDRIYFHDQAEIHRAVAELATAVRAHLTILDATSALTTAGPEGPGVVEELKTLVIGTDPVAVDAYAVGLTLWNKRKLSAEEVPHIRLAHELEIGNIDLKSLTIAEIG